MIYGFIAVRMVIDLVLAAIISTQTGTWITGGGMWLLCWAFYLLLFFGVRKHISWNIRPQGLLLARTRGVVGRSWLHSFAPPCGDRCVCVDRYRLAGTPRLNKLRSTTRMNCRVPRVAGFALTPGYYICPFQGRRTVRLAREP